MDTQTKKSNDYNIMIGSGIFLLAVAGGLLARKLWTDYNNHDPGITELELLNYPIEDDTGIPKKRRYRQKKLRTNNMGTTCFAVTILL